MRRAFPEGSPKPRSGCETCGLPRAQPCKPSGISVQPSAVQPQGQSVLGTSPVQLQEQALKPGREHQSKQEEAFQLLSLVSAIREQGDRRIYCVSPSSWSSSSSHQRVLQGQRGMSCSVSTLTQLQCNPSSWWRAAGAGVNSTTLQQRAKIHHVCKLCPLG